VGAITILNAAAGTSEALPFARRRPHFAVITKQEAAAVTGSCARPRTCLSSNSGGSAGRPAAAAGLAETRVPPSCVAGEGGEAV
jgi:hypothetical protein